jgi:hypothetical protein
VFEVRPLLTSLSLFYLLSRIYFFSFLSLLCSLLSYSLLFLFASLTFVIFFFFLYLFIFLSFFLFFSFLFFSFLFFSVLFFFFFVNRYALEHGCEADKNACDLAAHARNAECLKFLFARGYPIGPGTCTLAAYNNNLEGTGEKRR